MISYRTMLRLRNFEHPIGSNISLVFATSYLGMTLSYFFMSIYGVRTKDTIPKAPYLHILNRTFGTTNQCSLRTQFYW